MFELIKRKFPKVPQKKYDLKYVKQKYDWDCGQACLRMLGYDSYNIFPSKALSSEELLKKIPNVIDMSGESESKKYFFEKPMMFSIDVPWQDDNHWILCYKDKTYCPSLGVFYSKYYRKGFKRFACQVPFFYEIVQKQKK
jgi:hypothetical protein